MHSVNPVVCDQVNQPFMSKQTTAVRQASTSLSFPGTNQAHKYLHISTYIHTAIQYTYVHANIFLKIFNLCDHVSASRWSCAPSHLWTHRVTTSFAAKVLQASLYLGAVIIIFLRGVRKAVLLADVKANTHIHMYVCICKYIVYWVEA